MTALAGGPSYPSFKFGAVGSSVSGIVIDFNDMQEKDFASGQLKTYSDGNPVMQTRVTLETTPGNKDSRVSVYIKAGRMAKAVRMAIRESGAQDVTEGSRLTITHTGTEAGKGAQPAKLYDATYVPFDPTDDPSFQPAAATAGPPF